MIPVELQTFAHPQYRESFNDWERARDCYEGGTYFRDRYLQRHSKRETQKEFDRRKALTPIPNPIARNVNGVRNSLMQRMANVVRNGGPISYQSAVAGQQGGVDRCGRGMTSFLGEQVIVELLLMGQVGVYVDMPRDVGPTVATSSSVKPYVYRYKRENIVNWVPGEADSNEQFSRVLLRDCSICTHEQLALPTGYTHQYRYIWRDKSTGFIKVQFYDKDLKDKVSDQFTLEIKAFPFILFDIGQSVVRDACSYQIACLNLESSATNYGFRSNFPFYVEQRDPFAVGAHLKRTSTEEGTSTSGGQGADEEVVEVGDLSGRTYAKEAPAFIAPPTDPLVASMAQIDRLDQTIGKLITTAIDNLSDDKGTDFESGLAYVGHVLEAGERRVAECWANYLRAPEPATIVYPSNWVIRSDKDRIEEAERLSGLLNTVPGRGIKRELSKTISSALLSGRVSAEKLASIYKEIDESPFTTSDPEVIRIAHEAGFAGTQVCSIALGFDEDEHIQARADHADRLKRIQEAQSAESSAINGVDDTSGNPAQFQAEQKEASRNTDDKPTTRKRVRGKGRKV